MTFFPLSTWAEDEIYLDSINLLESQKSAYLTTKDGNKTEVREGDRVGMWMVVKIEEQSIFLTMESGKTIELPLHSRLPIALDQDPKLVVDQAPPLTDHELPPDTQALEEKSPPVEEKVEEKVAEEPPLAEKPTPATAEEIPPGHRKVHTPFGDFIVKEEETVKQNQDNSQTVPPPAKKEFAPLAKEEPIPVDKSTGAEKPVPPSSPEAVKSSPEAVKSSTEAVKASPEAVKSSSDSTTPAKTEEPIPPGYRKIQTPFGEFVVKDKEEKTETNK